MTNIMSTRISELILDNNSYAVCKGMNAEFLERSFEKSLNKIQHVSLLIKELGNYEGTRELQEDLLVYALHYLVKGAKIPILNQDKNGHFSYLEFISDSNPTYYRSQG